ncbi:MGH1-like glycoside hydrolase domain-containing protein [Arachidicoccus terrestris]|uniref:MGH1-like glycoside hydrolase domain-containing protein n=1 Tax=Arachidicoccus terrestris TaxID=2875539 RepID=UPI001CC617BE|nr:glucosidase [Arachidicoccus terrestris]UAY56359.1 glucosidase [Arachidicoccus terrestris]
MTAEQQRLIANAKTAIPLEKWGPYLAERQWGTVREDYSENGDAWNYFPFSHAASRAYRWGEDGIAGISDMFQNLCFAIGLWNGVDGILKERLFGVGNYEGNHGEDVKELYYYLDNIPSHYYMRYLYKYPQLPFPYDQLLEENRKRTALDEEYELLDTGVFQDNNYFDVDVTYAKYDKTDIGIRITVTNRSKNQASLTVLPTLWFYNRWQSEPDSIKPSITEEEPGHVRASHERLGNYYLYYPKTDERYFTDNETNFEKLFGKPNIAAFTKDAIQEAVIYGTHKKELSEQISGTKFSPVYHLDMAPGEVRTLYLRLSNREIKDPFDEGATYIFQLRKHEADAFYHAVLPKDLSGDALNIQRQAFAGLLWNKQYYHYDIEKWIQFGDGIVANNEVRARGRNWDWQHIKNQDIILMPDKWEYPWYAAWDLAFQCIALARIDVVFAKHQLSLIMREWYMKPDGQLPAYEWSFSDVNPPLQAWSALEIYQIEKKQKGSGPGDIVFLKKVFHKLLINFTWWINRKDPNGKNIFQGGFLGLDNIGAFNRNMPLHSELKLEQADGTSWMGMYALNMMDIALEIALYDPSFEDTATKFFEHFVLIAESLNELGMWNEEDHFYYDVLVSKSGDPLHLRIQSIVGLTTLFAASIIRKPALKNLKDFTKRISWFENYRKENGKFWPNEEKQGSDKILISLIPKERLVFLLERVLSETEFLSDGGIRGLSKYHKDHPYEVTMDGILYRIQYDPGDATSDFFGGNSNWRGPIWIPINYLLIRSILQYGRFYQDSLKVEYPTGSGNLLNLLDVATELTKRVISLFLKDEKGRRRLNGKQYDWFYDRPENNDLVLFYEYFNGDTGRGLGASHQTGWTALVAELISEIHKKMPAEER